MVFGAKRSIGLNETPSKLHKGEPSDEGSWNCTICGNLNFAHRSVCNSRSCGAPKDNDAWTCPACGNDNFAGKIFCNMRRCQQVRPGATMQQIQQHMGAGGPQADKGGKGGNAGKGGGKGGTGGGGGKGYTHGGDPRAAPELGAWTCDCGNLNFAGRVTCNARSCGKPAPRQQAWGMSNIHMPAQGKGGAAPPDGAWVCSACQNVNWPTRDSCNSKSCGAPRHLVDGGAPPRPGEAAAPEGSWTCSGCNNVNFPNRTSCNRKSCGLPKPA